MAPAEAYEATIVVPVYNVQDYLQECLDSIAAQTVFDRCRVVIVDDGSTDSSGVIAKQFASGHANVAVHVQENAGLGAARNAGMDLADTRYIMFCDSDDILPEGAAEALLKSVVKHKAVVAIGDMETFPVPSLKNTPWKRAFGQGSKAYGTLVDAPSLIFSPSACNKIFDLDHIRRGGYRFAEGVHFEDAFMTLPLMLGAQKIAVVDELVYLYRKRPTNDSIMDSLFTRVQNYWDHLALVETVANCPEGQDVFQRDAIEQFIIRSLQGFVMRAHELFDEEELRTMFDRCRKVYGNVRVENVVEYTVNARHRVPYLAFLLDDFELFARPWEVLRGVKARAGDLYLDYDVPAGLLPLAKIGATSTLVEQIRLSPSGKELEVSGQFTLDGLPLAKPMTTELLLRVRGSGINVPARTMSRSDRKRVRDDLEWSGFTASVPINRLKEGQNVLRLVYNTRTGEAARQCRISTGLMRSARSISVGSRRILPSWPEHSYAELTVQIGKGRAGARRWARTMRREDLQHALKRGPFWAHRLLRLATRPLMNRRHIWLIGERKETVQDNSGHLFRHVRTVARKKDAYYVIARRSPDRARLRGLGKIVTHGSLRHKFLLLHASALINSYDIDSYMLPESWNQAAYLRHLNWRVGARRVFLQHGVIHNDVSGGAHRAVTGVDLVVSSAANEAEFLAERMDYRNGSVQILGLPRFDALVPERGHRRILFMPTWRDYLSVPSYGNGEKNPKVAFEGSLYQRFMTDFLSSEKLLEALRRHDYTLEFLPHYEMRDMVGGVLPDDQRISLVDQSRVSVQDALRRCDLFVTDWSSTAFDVAYMGTPLVYAQFDPEDFWSGHYRKGYFEAAANGFGPVCGSAEEAVDAVIRYLESGCVREQEYTARAESFFPLRDRDNSARVYAAIKELTSGRPRASAAAGDEAR